jgi:hypothetical protein
MFEKIENCHQDMQKQVHPQDTDDFVAALKDLLMTNPKRAPLVSLSILYLNNNRDAIKYSDLAVLSCFVNQGIMLHNMPD